LKSLQIQIHGSMHGIACLMEENDMEVRNPFTFLVALPKLA
jgi:hypothetical protein